MLVFAQAQTKIWTILKIIHDIKFNQHLKLSMRWQQQTLSKISNLAIHKHTHLFSLEKTQNKTHKIDDPQTHRTYKVPSTLLTKLLKLFLYKIHKNMTLIKKQEFVLFLSLYCSLPNFPWSSLSCKFDKSTSSFYGYMSIIPHQVFQDFKHNIHKMH